MLDIAGKYVLRIVAQVNITRGTGATASCLATSVRGFLGLGHVGLQHVEA